MIYIKVTEFAKTYTQYPRSTPGLIYQLINHFNLNFILLGFRIHFVKHNFDPSLTSLILEQPIHQMALLLKHQLLQLLILQVNYLCLQITQLFHVSIYVSYFPFK